MKMFTNPNASLSLVADQDEIELLQEIKERVEGNDHLFLAEMLDRTGLSPNGRLYSVLPDQIGAITEAPILTDELEIDEAGKVVRLGRVWWFPQYMLKDFAQQLIDTGSVIFSAVPA